MGLAVAYQLALDGHRPIVFEADDRVGGQAAAFDFGGLEIERYYHFHCVSDRAYLAILDELGLSDKMHWVATRMAYWYQGRLQPWGDPLALLRFEGLGLAAKVRYGLHAFLCTRRKDWRPLDGIEAAVRGPHALEGATLTARPVGNREFLIVTKRYGKVFTQGSLKLSNDGRVITNSWWNPDRPDDKGTLVYEKK